MERDLTYISINKALEPYLEFELKYYINYLEYEDIYLIRTKSINSIPVILERIEGLTLVGNMTFNSFLFSSEKFNLLLEVLELSPYKSFVYPDYKKTIVNISESFKKFYGKATKYETIKEIDSVLDENVSHVIFVVLDGLGSCFLNKNTKFFSKYKVSNLSAVVPATTANAIPAFDNSEFGSKTLYLAWQMYFKQFKCHYELFSGEGYYDKTIQKKDITNIFKREYFYDSLDVSVSKIMPSFSEGGYTSINDMFKKTLLSTKNKKTFTYVYCDEPDHSLHAYGDTKFSRNLIKTYDERFEQLSKNLDKDTVMIITADHGHIDCVHVKLYLFKEITSMYKTLPAFEGRFVTFFIKDKYLNVFRETFNRYFNQFYNIYSKSELLSSGILGEGPYNLELKDYLGDFTAVAKSDLYLCSLEGHNSISHHAGMTEKEMTTPLIIFKK